MSGFGISVVYPKVEDAKRVYDTFSKGGEVNMPMGKTFRVESFGVIDRYGTLDDQRRQIQHVACARIQKTTQQFDRSIVN